MKIIITCSEALVRCHNWEEFCKEFGLSEYCCAEGFGDSEITLTESEAVYYGLINKC